MYKGVKEIKVAGVTFNNKDGSSRQELLREFDREEAVAVSLLEHEHKGKPAFHILVNGKIIGNIPKDKAPFIVRNRKGIAFDDIEIAIYQDKKGENYGAAVYIPYEAYEEWLDEEEPQREIVNPAPNSNTYSQTPKSDEYKPFYTTTFFNVLMILFVTPLGLFTMWMFSSWSKGVKIAVTVGCALIFMMYYWLLLQLGATGIVYNTLLQNA